MRAVQRLLTAMKVTPGTTAAAPEQPIRLTIVQYGDYAEAVARFAAGDEENYYAQKYTVDFLARLRKMTGVEAISVISFAADRPEAITESGILTAGIKLYPQDRGARFKDLLAMIEVTRPTHLIVGAPIEPAIRWGQRRKLPVLPLFADSFRGGGFRQRWRNHRLARLLNRPEIEFVANHNLAASLDLARIGVTRDKIVPFDWPEIVSARDYPAKPAPPPGRPLRLIYVGQLKEAKGVGDAVRALAILRQRGRDAELTLVGTGDAETFRALARQEGVDGQITLTGLLPHRRVLAEMRAHDVVLVPSHHDYPEGLPMTLYEALCVRTPLVVSDHPMFRLRINDGVQALVHPERDPEGLADCVERLAANPEIYAGFSQRAETSVKDYLCPLKWDRLLEDFLVPTARSQLRNYSLALYPYFSD